MKLDETGRVEVVSPAYLERSFREDGQDRALAVTGRIEANNGESLAQLARGGVGIARVGRFAVEDDLATGQLVALLEAYNPQDREPLHAVFVGGSTMPARARVFVDFLVERFGDPGA